MANYITECKKCGFKGVPVLVNTRNFLFPKWRYRCRQCQNEDKKTLIFYNKYKFEQKELSTSVGQKVGLLYLQLSKEMDKAKQPFLPDKDFYANWKKSDDDLIRMSSTILNHLDEPMGGLRVLFVDGLGAIPGIFSGTQGEVILINKKYKSDPFSCAAVLAHEIMHYYLFKKNVSLADTHENELLTDVATIHLGLGVLVVNGMTFQSSWFITILALFFGMLYIKTQQSSFGYFKSYQYIIYLKEYIRQNKISFKEVSYHIHPRAWYFFRGISLVNKLSRKSMFFKQALKKLVINTAGVIVTLGLLGFVGYSLNSNSQSSTSSSYSSNPELINEIEGLNTNINLQSNTVNSLEKELSDMKAKLDSYKNQNMIDSYNALVPKYNDLLGRYKSAVNSYNNMVNNYNNIIKQ